MPASVRKSKSKAIGTKILGRCTNREKEDYERWFKDASLGRCPEALESRSIFLRLHPCDACVAGSKACTLSRPNSSSLRCQTCRTGKRRCPRQVAFEIYFIAKMMSKSQAWVAAVHSGDLIVEVPSDSSVTIADTTTANMTMATRNTDTTADPRPTSIAIGETSSSGHGTEAPRERVVIDLSVEMSDTEGQDGDTKMAVKNEAKQEERGGYLNDVATHRGNDSMDVDQVDDKFELVKLNKKLALCRSFLLNAFDPFSRDPLASNVNLVLQKLEAIGQDFSQALHAEDSASMEDLIGELAVCRDRLCKAVGQLGVEVSEARVGDVNKMKRHLDTLKEILQGFSALLDCSNDR